MKELVWVPIIFCQVQCPFKFVFVVTQKNADQLSGVMSFQEREWILEIGGQSWTNTLERRYGQSKMKLNKTENLKWSDYSKMYWDEMRCNEKDQDLPKFFSLKSLKSGKKGE